MTGLIRPTPASDVLSSEFVASDLLHHQMPSCDVNAVKLAISASFTISIKLDKGVSALLSQHLKAAIKPCAMQPNRQVSAEFLDVERVSQDAGTANANGLQAVDCHASGLKTEPFGSTSLKANGVWINDDAHRDVTKRQS